MKWFPKYIPLFLIRIYQKTLSFDHGPLRFLYPYGFCRYIPTCSEYFYESVTIYGFFRGSFMGILRILRCHPFAKGGFDPVKKPKISSEKHQ